MKKIVLIFLFLIFLSFFVVSGEMGGTVPDPPFNFGECAPPGKCQECPPDDYVDNVEFCMWDADKNGYYWDGSCVPKEEEICDDGIDNDCDNLIDDEDPDCMSFVGLWKVSTDIESVCLVLKGDAEQDSGFGVVVSNETTTVSDILLDVQFGTPHLDNYYDLTMDGVKVIDPPPPAFPFALFPKDEGGDSANFGFLISTSGVPPGFFDGTKYFGEIRFSNVSNPLEFETVSTTICAGEDSPGSCCGEGGGEEGFDVTPDEQCKELENATDMWFVSYRLQNNTKSELSWSGKILNQDWADVVMMIPKMGSIPEDEEQTVDVGGEKYPGTEDSEDGTISEIEFSVDDCDGFLCDYEEIVELKICVGAGCCSDGDEEDEQDQEISCRDYTKHGLCSYGTKICKPNTSGDCESKLCITNNPATEVCDGWDNDCDGSVDEELDCSEPEPPGEECISNSVIPCSDLTKFGICTSGVKVCFNGFWSASCIPTFPENEICEDDLDNDCDGFVDEYCDLDETELIPKENVSQECINLCGIYGIDAFVYVKGNQYLTSGCYNLCVNGIIDERTDDTPSDVKVNKVGLEILVITPSGYKIVKLWRNGIRVTEIITPLNSRIVEKEDEIIVIDPDTQEARILKGFTPDLKLKILEKLISKHRIPFIKIAYIENLKTVSKSKLKERFIVQFKSKLCETQTESLTMISEIESNDSKFGVIEIEMSDLHSLVYDPCIVKIGDKTNKKLFEEYVIDAIEEETNKEIDEMMLVSSAADIIGFSDLEEYLHRDFTIKQGQVSVYQQFVTPDAEVVQDLINGLSKEEQYLVARDWVWMSDMVLFSAAEKWLFPEEFINTTPEMESNPLRDKIASDCSEQANTLVSMFRASGVEPENVRVVLGTVSFSGVESGHAWVEIREDDKWLVLDPTTGHYYDEETDTEFKRRETDYYYWATHKYPIVDVWAYYNDVYFAQPDNIGDAPESWGERATLNLDLLIDDSLFEEIIEADVVLEPDLETKMFHLGIVMLVLVLIIAGMLFKGRKR